MGPLFIRWCGNRDNPVVTCIQCRGDPADRTTLPGGIAYDIPLDKAERP